jgi:pSer/pThr/pTyr-binding forkhead associated (FHA) protein
VSKLTLSFRGKVLKIFPVTQGTLTVGSDPSCFIHIDSLAVSPTHAKIATHGDESIITTVDTDEGVYLYQDKITEHKLKDGDILRVGKHNLSFSYEEVNSLSADDSATSIDISGANDQMQEAGSHTAATTAQHKLGWLQILNGQNLGKTLSLNRSMTNLGKPGMATAVITRRNDGYFISHLEGKVLPVVGNEAIGARSVKLKEGDVIQIGPIKMQFYLE